MIAPYNQDDGFVLAEILVGIFVLGLAAVAFLYIAQQSTDNIYRAETENRIWQLSKRLEMVERSQTTGWESEKSGQDISGRFRWEVTSSLHPKYQSGNSEQPHVVIIKIQVDDLNTEMSPDLTRTFLTVRGQG